MRPLLVEQRYSRGVSERARRISDYAFLSDCHSAALVREGDVEWLCLPRFDSPSCFGSMLDGERGGSFSMRPRGDFRFSRSYEPATNVLVSRWQGADGCLEVTDCLLVHASSERQAHAVRPYHALMRQARCLQGRVQVDVLCDPRPGFGRSIPELHRRQGRWLIGSGDERLVLDTSAPLSHDDRPGLHGRLALAAGDSAAFVLQYAGGADGEVPAQPDAGDALETTLEFWRRWSSRLQYHGPYRDEVLRSALVLKGLTYAPTGGIVAAPTTSLPEWFGGERNWDYRYCWLRDSTLTLYALERIGYRHEAYAFERWLEHAAQRGPREIRIAYTVDGQEMPPEQQLDWLSGFRESRPVRIGNGARDQTQLDIFGELLDVAFFGDKQGIEISDTYWSFLAQLADFVCEHWREPDCGIWEMRIPPKQYVYSKVLCWVCLNRAVRLAQALGVRQPVDRWSHEMDKIREDVLRNGYNPKIGAFVQWYGSDHLDAANLALPIVGFISARDPRMAQTIRLTDERLRKNGLVQRYVGVEDGLSGSEGAFLICSFWLVDALIMLGERKKARQHFEELLAHCNDVGLLSEEFDADSEEMLGNFPQAFSHLSLITSALNLAGGRPNRRHHSESDRRAQVSATHEPRVEKHERE